MAAVDSRGIKMPFTIAVLHQKGGVGKTTIATSLYAHVVCALGDSSDSAGIMDLDPQGNATVWAIGKPGYHHVRHHAGAEAFTLPHGEVARDDSAGIKTENVIEKHAVRCSRLGGGLVFPSNPYMAAHTFTDLVTRTVPVDVLFIDTPPYLSDAMFRAIVSQADVVLAPVQMEPHAMQNVPDLVSDICHTGNGVLVDERRLRFVVNMRQRCSTHDAFESALRGLHGALVSDVVIPRATCWADVSSHTVRWNPKGKPAKMAAELWADIQTACIRRAAA